MALNGKQRAYLRSLCNTLNPVVYLGKEGVTDTVLQTADEAISAREIIKCALQRGCDLDTREACESLCEALGAEPVQCIGNRFCIYRPADEEENRKIELP